MIIKSIRIDGFGKHQGLSLEFQQGLNVVYGSNEVGKSTLQAFIKAMFYGLNSRTRTIAENPRKKYTPWHADTMGGEIRFSHNELEYALTRHFGETKAKDKMSLTLVSTGEVLPIDPKTEPGEFLFHISQATFESTIFISQLDSKIDSGTAKDSDILAKLSNLAGTGDENIDIHAIEGNLNKPMLSLHAARGQGGLIDRLKARKSELQEELAAFRDTRNTSIKIIEDLTVYQSRRDSILEEMQRVKTQLQLVESENSMSEFRQIQECMDRKKRQEALLAETKELLTADGAFIDRSYYETCLVDFQKVENATEELAVPGQILNAAKETVSSIDEKLTALEYLNHFDIDTFENISSLRNSCSRAIERKRTLDLQLTDAMVNLETQQEQNKQFAKKKKILSLGSIVCGILCVAGAALWNFLAVASYACLGVAAIALLVLLIYGSMGRRAGKEQKHALIYANASVKQCNEQLKAVAVDFKQLMDDQPANTQKKLAEILGNTPVSTETLEEVHTLLSKYISNTLTELGCQSIGEMREKLSLYHSYKLQREEAMQTVTSYTETFTAKETASCNITAAFYEKYASIFSLASLEDIKETLQQIFHNLNQYDSLIMELNYANNYLKNALNGRSYEAMAAEAEQMAGLAQNALDPTLSTDAKVLESQLDSLDRDLDVIKDAISDTNIRIASNFKSYREESEILSDLDEVSQAIAEAEYQYECMKLAKSTMKDAFDELQQSFGPVLNNRTEEILNSIKPDHPMTIRVNRDFQITLSPKDSLQPYEIDYFSYGAQDQAYFALRMAISDILSADFEGFPLLLDDPFTQYDEKRMHGALDFLSSVAQTRQVFIFTCHKNVTAYSEELGGTAFLLGEGN